MKSSIPLSRGPSPLWQPELDRPLRYVRAAQVRPRGKPSLSQFLLVD
jgi:hypothetical protein